jgi:hypothetical protein
MLRYNVCQLERKQKIEITPGRDKLKRAAALKEKACETSLGN